MAKASGCGAIGCLHRHGSRREALLARLCGPPPGIAGRLIAPSPAFFSHVAFPPGPERQAPAFAGCAGSRERDSRTFAVKARPHRRAGFRCRTRRGRRSPPSFFMPSLHRSINRNEPVLCLPEVPPNRMSRLEERPQGTCIDHLCLAFPAGGRAQRRKAEAPAVARQATPASSPGWTACRTGSRNAQLFSTH